MNKFTKSELPALSIALSGKIIMGLEIDDSHMDKSLIFKFTDGTELKLTYDWIYGYEVGPS